MLPASKPTAAEKELKHKLISIVEEDRKSRPATALDAARRDAEQRAEAEKAALQRPPQSQAPAGPAAETGAGAGTAGRPRWAAVRDEGGNVCWYANEATGQTSLVDPAQQEVLDGEWVSLVDPMTRYPYWFNVVSGASGWTRPGEQQQQPAESTMAAPRRGAERGGAGPVRAHVQYMTSDASPYLAGNKEKPGPRRLERERRMKAELARRQGPRQQKEFDPDKDIDPMDPAFYTDAPLGSWSTGTRLSFLPG
eukprot:m51a1_g2486 hypothetical protein (252) ;mRNA; f:84840-85833